MSDVRSAHDAAIAAALSQNWEEAIRVNQEILEEDSVNIDALNRLGFAHTQLGNTSEAKRSYEKVLNIDKYNQIAQKNLLKLKTKHMIPAGNGGVVSPLMFLEEPGKTRSVALVNLAPANTLATLSCGQEVKMKVKKHCIEIRDIQNTYLGALPDDVSFKLGKFIAGGNAYQMVIRSIGKNALTVFIREVSRGKLYQDQPSFTPASTFVAQGRMEDVTDRPNTHATGEEGEESE